MAAAVESAGSEATPAGRTGSHRTVARAAPAAPGPAAYKRQRLRAIFASFIFNERDKIIDSIYNFHNFPIAVNQ